MTKKIKVSKEAKEFDYGDTPNPLRDKGKTGYKGSVKLLNPRKKKKYNALKKQIAFGDMEYEMFNKDKEKYEKVKDKVIEKKYGGRIDK